MNERFYDFGHRVRKTNRIQGLHGFLRLLIFQKGNLPHKFSGIPILLPASHKGRRIDIVRPNAAILIFFLCVCFSLLICLILFNVTCSLDILSDLFYSLPFFKGFSYFYLRVTLCVTVAGSNPASLC